MSVKKLIRITTIPLSLKVLLKGQLTFMSNHFEIKAVSSGPQKELDEVAIHEGIDVIELEMTRTISPVKDLIAIWEMVKLFRIEKPSIVHTHTPKAGLVGMIAAKITGVPYRLHTVAGLPLMEAKGVKRWVLNNVEKIIYAASTKVYPNSNGLFQFIMDNKFTKPSKLKVIANGSSNGIDTAYFDPKLFGKEDIEDLKQELNITSNDFVFVFVGRLVGDKGINELVEAFSEIKLPNIKLLLVGHLEKELDPLSLKTTQTIEDNINIIMVGFQKDVCPYFAISDCLVFPSYREGFPNVVMQAGAMELPSIVTDINGCNEIIIDGKNGTIIPAKSIDWLKNAMIRMIKDEKWHNKLQSNAREMITSRYDQELVWNALLDEYNSVLTNAK